MPVTRRHEQGVSMLQDDLVALGKTNRRIFFKLQFILLRIEIFLEIDKAQNLPGLAIDLMLLLEREKQHPFTPDELGVDDMREIDVEVHMGDGPPAAYEQHGITLYKTFHQLLGPFEILHELGSVLEDVEKKDAPFRRTPPDHIDVFAKLHVAVSGIYRRISIALHVIVNTHLHLPYDGFEIIPVPLFKSRPLFGQTPDDQRFHRSIVLIPEIFGTNTVHGIYRL